MSDGFFRKGKSKKLRVCKYCGIQLKHISELKINDVTISYCQDCKDKAIAELQQRLNKSEKGQMILG